MADYFLVVAAFFTSMVAAVGGIGGGVILIALMPGLLPPAAIIPVHGLVQISSNVSRAVLGFRDIAWPLALPYFAGAVVGAVIGSRFISDFHWEWMPLFLGAFILVTTWMPRISRAPDVPAKFALLGAVQTALSLFVGISGPMNMPFLLRENLGRDRTVVTHAVQMTGTHVFKVVAFGLAGFVFGPYWMLVAGMIVAAMLGSYAGTRVRGYVSEALFKKGLKVLITLLAVRMMVRVVW